jgi:dimethylamine/trimethylamine dehydrogenase
VALAEARTELGGRVTLESKLPGLAAWARVRDYRVGQIAKMANVEVYPASKLTAEDVLEFGVGHVCLATGSTWRRDGVGRFHLRAIPLAGTKVYTPDDIMAGNLPSGHVLIYDDDHYYMGGVLAELLVRKGCKVTMVTPSTMASAWTVNTLEQEFIQKKLLELGVDVRVTRALTAADADGVSLACTYTGREEQIACDAIVLVTARLPVDHLYTELLERRNGWADRGISSVRVIGDAEAPSSAIAWSTYAGHRYAEELDEPEMESPSFRREVAELAS